MPYTIVRGRGIGVTLTLSDHLVSMLQHLSSSDEVNRRPSISAGPAGPISRLSRVGGRWNSRAQGIVGIISSLVQAASRAAELSEEYGLVERRGFLASILQNITFRDGALSAECRPAFRILAQMAAEPTPPPNVRGGGSRGSKLAVWGG